MSDAFAFGPFRLLVARRELLAHGVPVTLGQRAFEILLTLVRRHGQLVTKDELMAEVWPGVVVEARCWPRPATASVTSSLSPDAAIASWRPLSARAAGRPKRTPPTEAPRRLPRSTPRATISPSS
ncbi:MAG: hypothetical protein E6G76_13540 [Alphaproteobacteria bacterium]|nr:MAG: hypothetical protein E6G76_13540 [Alphaproteobacteria bacterium]